MVVGLALGGALHAVEGKHEILACLAFVADKATIDVLMTVGGLVGVEDADRKQRDHEIKLAQLQRRTSRI